jgi:hypothetical protein
MHVINTRNDLGFCVNSFETPSQRFFADCAAAAAAAAAAVLGRRCSAFRMALEFAYRFLRNVLQHTFKFTFCSSLLIFRIF